MPKLQYVSNEDLRVSFPAFFDAGNGLYVIGTDTASVTVKDPHGGTQVLPLVFDADVNFWTVTIASGSFIEGPWLFFAESDDSGAVPQFRVAFWGDWVDDIQELRQSALGRWKIEGAQLTIFEDDGVTPFRVFDLLDDTGAPSVSPIFERTPV